MKSGFWVIQKITSCLSKSIHDIINYSTFIFPFECERYGKEGKKLQKCKYVEDKKSFFDEKKKAFFIIFEELSFGEKTEYG